jgi:hypothetical protein
MIRLCAGQAPGQPSLPSDAAALLNWDGDVIPSLDILGSRVCVVASLNNSEHERRQIEGSGGALTDAWMLQLEEGRGTEIDAPAQWRPSPVVITGVLAIRQTWRAALTVASGFATFCPRAVVLPKEEARSSRFRLEAGICGVGIISRDARARAVSLLQRPSPFAVSNVNRRLVHRVIEEAVYERLLADLVTTK